jgi:hypothetical protein
MRRREAAITLSRAMAVLAVCSVFAICVIIWNHSRERAQTLEQSLLAGGSSTPGSFAGPPSFSSLPRILQRIGMPTSLSEPHHQGIGQRSGNDESEQGKSDKGNGILSTPPSLPSSLPQSASIARKSDIPSDSSLRDLAFSYMTEDDKDLKPPIIRHQGRRGRTGASSDPDMGETRISFSQYISGGNSSRKKTTDVQRQRELKAHIREQLRLQARLARKARKAAERAARLKKKVEKVQEKMIKEDNKADTMWNKLTDAVSSFDVASKNMLRRSENLF